VAQVVHRCNRYESRHEDWCDGVCLDTGDEEPDCKEADRDVQNLPWYLMSMYKGTALSVNWNETKRTRASAYIPPTPTQTRPRW